jgi:alpha-aminoadipic semialdehyde synthase
MSGGGCIGIRRESIDPHERRAALAPIHVRDLTSRQGIEVRVTPSPTRVFDDAEYARAGALLTEDLAPCTVIFGVKEVPPAELTARARYCFFSHTLKGQLHNMPMLRRILELGCTLLDYELVRNERGRRLIAFGSFAGYAGMVNTLWALGRRLRWEGIDNPFDRIRRPHRYEDLEQVRAAVRQVGKIIAAVGLSPAVIPLVFGICGHGRVSRGAAEILKLLPTRRLEPADLPRFFSAGEFSDRVVYRVEFHQDDMYEPADTACSFDRYRFHRYPGEYRSRIEGALPLLSVLVNGIYWEPRYPRLVSSSFLRHMWERNPSPRLRVIGDITCDVEGSIEATLKAATLDRPVYVYEPLKHRVQDGVEGVGPVIMAVDKLPSELPKQATEAFGDALLPFVPDLARTRYDAPLERIELPQAFRGALIAHRGRLAEAHAGLADHLASAPVTMDARP